MQGQMVALGNSGRIAVALSGGGPSGRSGQRLALVDAQVFVYGETMDCVLSTGQHCFEQGLSAIELGNANGGGV